MSKVKGPCKDCNCDTYGNSKDYYMVHDEIWDKHGAGRDMLCIDCLEKRIGRKLVYEDFTDCPLNNLFNDYINELKVKERILKLDKEDLGILIEALANPPEPNEALKEAWRIGKIKKALYKEKPIARQPTIDTDSLKDYVLYAAILADGTHVAFEIPNSEYSPDVFGDEMPAQLLIRWLV